VGKEDCQRRVAAMRVRHGPMGCLQASNSLCDGTAEHLKGHRLRRQLRIALAWPKDGRHDHLPQVLLGSQTLSAILADVPLLHDALAEREEVPRVGFVRRRTSSEGKGAL